MAFEVQDFEEIEQANKIFTDRVEPRKAFWGKYKQYKENMELGKKNQITILTYYGIGGIGKSTLLHKLQTELENYKDERHISKEYKNDVIPYAYYDMKTDTSKKSILEGLRRILTKNYGFEFPVFELALNIYHLKTGEGIKNKKEEGIISSNQYVSVGIDIASAGIDFLSVAPLVGPMAAGTLKIIDTLVAMQKNKKKHREIELSKIQIDSPEEILQNLQLNFAKDISDNLKDSNYPLVIFFDSYEMLVNELATVGEPLMNDNWFRDIHNGLVTHIPNIIWVIAGREKIKWDHINFEWKDNFEQHLVGNLSLKDTMMFLAESGITDELVKNLIFDITKGIPVYLDICVKNYFYLIKNNILISRESIGNDQKELINRFMIYTDVIQKDILYIISCLDTWNKEYLIEWAKNNSYVISTTTLNVIIGSSFIEPIEGGNYKMHQLVRAVLFDQCDEELKRKVLKYDLESTKEKLKDSDATSVEYIILLKKYINRTVELMGHEDNLEEFYKEIEDSHLKRLVDTFQYDDVCQIYEILLQYIETNKIKEQRVAEIYMNYAINLRNCIFRPANSICTVISTRLHGG